MAASDPLTLLRQSCLSHALPTPLSASNEPTDLLQSTFLQFQSVTLHTDTPTRFTVRPNDVSEFHTLQQLLYVVLEKETGSADYMRKAGRVGLKVVGIVNRRMVLEYLEGGDAPEGRVLVESGDISQPVFEGDLPPTQPSSSSAALPPSTSYAALPPSLTTGLAPPKRKYEPSPLDRDAVKRVRSHQIALLDRNDSLRVTSPGAGALVGIGAGGGGKEHDFAATRKNINEGLIKPLRKYLMDLRNGEAKDGAGVPLGMSGMKGGRIGSSQSSAGVRMAVGAGVGVQDPSSSRSSKSRNALNNIIIISSAPTALISLWNVKKFLEEGIYESNDEAKARQQAEGNRRIDDVIIVYRNVQQPDGQMKRVKYLVVDNVDSMAKLTNGQMHEAWDRCLCTFVTGQEWQFKPYRWADPRELFKHVKGVYFHFAYDSVNPKIKEWKVNSLAIDPNRRHTDRQVVANFWGLMEGKR